MGRSRSAIGLQVTSLVLVLGCLASSAVAQDDPRQAPPSTEPGPLLPLDAEGYGGAEESPAAATAPAPASVRQEGDRAVIGSSNYRAEITAEGISFWTWPVSDRPADLRYTLQVVRFGEKVLYDHSQAGSIAPAVFEGAVIYVRAPGLEERYEARESGTEQLFTIDGPLPEGTDLTIEGQVASPLDYDLVPGYGVTFRGTEGKKSFAYGVATVIDATGKTVPGALELEGDRLSIQVPAEQLAGLRAPLTVDPLIGSNFRVTSSTASEREGAIAWDSTNNRYLVVYERLSGTEYDIYGQFVTTSGTLSGSAFAIRNQVGVWERNPDITFSPQTNRYIMACEYNNGDVIQVSLDSNGGYLGGWYLDNRRPPTGYSRDPKVVHQSGDTVCFVWSDSDASVPQNQWVLCERRDSNAVVQGGNDDWIIQSTTGGTAFRRPNLAYNTTDGRFYFVWEHTDSSARGVAITGDLQFYVGPSPNVTLSTSGRQPNVAWNSARNEWLAVWANNTLLGGPDYDLFMEKVQGGTNTGYLTGGIRIIDDFTLDQRNPVIRFQPGPDEYLVVYDEEYSATDHDLYAHAIWSHATKRGNYITINNGTNDTPLPWMATSATSLQFMTVWEDNRNSGTASWDIWAQRLTDDSPRVLKFDPPNKSTSVARDYPPRVVFSDPMNASTINTTNCRIIDTTTQTAITITLSYNSVTRTATLTPSTAMVANRTYRIEITAGVQDTSANALPSLAQSVFTTGSDLRLVDTDQDGLLDLEEQRIGTSTTSADTDGDGLGDFAEFSWTDPLRTDTDNDGTSDAAEFLAGTNPLNPNSGGVPGYDVTRPFVVSFSPKDGAVNVELATNVFVQFSEPINTSTVVYGTSFKVENITPDPDVLLSGTITYQNGNRVLKFDPSSNLPTSSSIRVAVPGGSGMIADSAGNTIQTTKTATFATVASSGTPTIADKEALHHPSFGESTAAGQMVRHSGDGNVLESPSPLCAYPATDNTPGFQNSCGCADECSLREGDFLCTGVRETFLQNRTVVSLNNGVFIHGRIDWAYSDRSLHSVMFGRTYRSNAGGQTPTPGMFGYRWVSNWETALLNFQETGLPFDLRTPDGRVYTVNWSGGNWVLPTGFYGRFYLDNPNSELKLIFRNGLTYAYSVPSGRLKYVEDRNGQRQTPGYTGSQLTSITDATGRVTTFTYTSGRVTSMTTYDNLVIAFGYTSDDLTSVTFPATDEFQSGRQEQYTYTGNHLMATLVNGRGQTYLTNRYDASGLVESQDHISGTHFYLYDFSNPNAVKTTTIDRMGNGTEVVHDANGSPATITQFSRGVNELDPTAQWVTSYTHDANGEVTKVVLPRGNVWKYVYGTNGHVIERRRKTADVADNDANDLVEKWKIDSQFGCVLRYMEPRASDPGITAAQKVAYTRFYFYDHEDITTRLSTETSEMGSTVAIAGNAEKTHGRTGTGQFPAKDTAVFGDNDGDGLPDRGGNLWITLDPAPRVVDPANPSQFQANRQVIEHFYSYNQPGQLLIHRDPLGDIERYQYYSGTFNLSTYPNAGFLLYHVVDSGLTSANLDLSTGDPSGASEPNGHLALRTTFAYDARGNTTSIRSPRGFGRTDDVFHTRMTHDQNNLLRTRTVSAPFNYQWSFFYDGNQMLTEERVPNVLANDANGNGIQDGTAEQTTGTPAYFSMTKTYCVCNDVLTETVDANSLALTTTYGYDLNQQRVLVRDAYGNVTTYVFDERDLVSRRVRGANDTSVAATTRFVYDANGNQIREHDDDLDVDTGDSPNTYTYDLFDRMTGVTDELSNTGDIVYDRAGFVSQQVSRGPDTGASSIPEVLSETFYEYDEIGRLFQIDRAHFDAVGETALADGLLSPPVANVPSRTANLNSSVFIYDADDRTTTVIDDNLHSAAFAYDAADRLTQSNDPRGNIRILRYDADGQVIDEQEQEVADVGAGQAYISRTFVDELGRPIVEVSPLGNSTRFLYDSRGNTLQAADAQADSTGNASALDAYAEHLFNASWPDIAVSGRGNRTVNTFDGASRLTSRVMHRTSDGTGNGSALDTITVSLGYDAASRLISQTDSNANQTRYAYDALSRRTAIINADATQRLFFYDRASNLRHVRDERGVVTRYTVDKLGRRTETTIQNLPPGAGQITYELYEYDGLSRMTRGENNHSILSPRYDSLGPVIREDQTINVGTDRLLKTDPFTSTVQKVVTASFDGVGNRTQIVYSGGTVVNETYDQDDRRKLVKDGATTVAEYMYIGSGRRLLERRLPQGAVTLYRTYDGDRRVTRHDQRRTTDSMRIAGFSYAYDRMGNRWYERTITNNTNPSEAMGSGEAYAYDSVYRMLDYYEGVPSASLDLLQNNTPRWGASITYATYRRYDLDAVGNRLQTQANGVVDVVYALNGDDFKTNQYTFTNDTFQHYDAAGDLLQDGNATFFYDSSDELVQSLQAVDTRYRHDVLGRRVSKRTASGNFPGWSYGHSVFIHFGPQLIEEYDAAGAFRKEWLYGVDVDEPIRQRAPDYADINGNGNTTELVALYYLTNSLGTVVALTDGTGVARERYVYDVWGTIRDVVDKNGASTGIAWTKVGNPWCFVGRQFAAEERLQLYWYRTRDYQPGTGQFLQRDPGGLWLDEATHGNGRIYGAANPVNNTDPTGQIVDGPHKHTKLRQTWYNKGFIPAWTLFEKFIVRMPTRNFPVIMPRIIYNDIVALKAYSAKTKKLEPVTVRYTARSVYDRALKGRLGKSFVTSHDLPFRHYVWVGVNCNYGPAMWAQIVRTLVHESIHVLAYWDHPAWSRYKNKEPYIKGEKGFRYSEEFKELEEEVEKRAKKILEKYPVPKK